MHLGYVSVGVKWKFVPNAYNVYIGQGSPLGNKYARKGMNDSTREVVCNAFHEDYMIAMQDKSSPMYQETKRLYNMVLSGIDVNLQCFCKHDDFLYIRCHGESIANLINNYAKAKHAQRSTETTG